MVLLGEDPPMPRENTWYWFMALGFTTLIIMSGTALIDSQGVIWATITSQKSAIFDIASWLGLMLLSCCIIIMQVALPSSTARIVAKKISLAMITMLVSMFCTKLNEFFPLPVVFIAWAMVAMSFISAWRDS